MLKMVGKDMANCIQLWKEDNRRTEAVLLELKGVRP